MAVLPTKKIAAAGGLIVFTLIGIASTKPPEDDKPNWKNLKIIPKTVNGVFMEALMNKYARDIGVACNYCHTNTKPGIVPIRADFPSDEKPEKRVARDMMKMTDRINKKYFNVENKYDLESVKAMKVSCRTCHGGHLMNPTHVRGK